MICGVGHRPLEKAQGRGRPITQLLKRALARRDLWKVHVLLNLQVQMVLLVLRPLRFLRHHQLLEAGLHGGAFLLLFELSIGFLPLGLVQFLTAVLLLLR